MESLEVWKAIKGLEGSHEVSSHGRVRSLHANGKKNIMKMHIRKGYYILSIEKHFVRHSFSINRLVAETFIGAPNHRQEVNHIDGDKLNNVLSNLEWVTHSENILHSTRVLKHGVGVRHPHAKLNPEQVREIRKLVAAGEGVRSVGRKYGVACQQIMNIRDGVTWKSVV